MMRLEFVMILIRKGAVGVCSVAMLTLQGAWSQLKICADQTACPSHAQLSPEPLLLQRDGQAQGLLLPPNRLQRLSYTRHSPPEMWCKGSAAPITVGNRRPGESNLCISGISHTYLIFTEVLCFHAGTDSP